jgi:ribosomal protein L37AE/L43A
MKDKLPKSNYGYQKHRQIWRAPYPMVTKYGLCVAISMDSSSLEKIKDTSRPSLKTFDVLVTNGSHEQWLPLCEVLTDYGVSSWLSFCELTEKQRLEQEGVFSCSTCGVTIETGIKGHSSPEYVDYCDEKAGTLWTHVDGVMHNFHPTSRLKEGQVCSSCSKKEIDSGSTKIVMLTCDTCESSYQERRGKLFTNHYAGTVNRNHHSKLTHVIQYSAGIMTISNDCTLSGGNVCDSCVKKEVSAGRACIFSMTCSTCGTVFPWSGMDPTITDYCASEVGFCEERGEREVISHYGSDYDLSRHILLPESRLKDGLACDCCITAELNSKRIVLDKQFVY